ncbi:uncharacterized protein LOC129880702 isoform X5 [Solanum dulcamara]|uniref:uncharacterized protein LOC129880702 isoform X5 n=1 Tax=Solanum dulcamara TaxID=45834 RepID=UPI002486C893|nr:uncharacterized protein LOC129880702 isoform X5 [Solanum dulcamara]
MENLLEQIRSLIFQEYQTYGLHLGSIERPTSSYCWTTLTRNSSVALGFSVSQSFPLSDMAPRGGGRSRYSGKGIADPVTSPLISSSTPDQAPSLPELSIPVTPNSVAVNVSVPSLSVGIETPRNNIVSKLRQIQLMVPAS